MRVAAYNLCFGGADRLEAIYTVLNALDADVIALTEADDRRVVEALAGRLSLHHVWAEGSGDRHIATLSRYPIVEWRIYNKPPLTQAVLEIKLGEFSIFNTHLLPYLLFPFEIRRWQAMGRLLEIIRERKPGRHLIVGDLNAIAPGDRVLQRANPPRMRRAMMLQFGFVFHIAIARLLDAGYVDCFRALHPGEDGFTWMPGNPTTRYDYIFADPVFARDLRACRVVDDLEAAIAASDHFPLLAEFEI